ncbi:MAG: hypothetical protein Q7J82_00530 [Coriobacteriia bacterium]|nr:hypothetical protein [Coriobacteriia bacterium]
MRGFRLTAAALLAAALFLTCGCSPDVSGTWRLDDGRGDDAPTITFESGQAHLERWAIPDVGPEEAMTMGYSVAGDRIELDRRISGISVELKLGAQGETLSARYGPSSAWRELYVRVD